MGNPRLRDWKWRKTLGKIELINQEKQGNQQKRGSLVEGYSSFGGKSVVEDSQFIVWPNGAYSFLIPCLILTPKPTNNYLFVLFLLC